jgi:NlpC/P60 family putative phage cell wall peptidase
MSGDQVVAAARRWLGTPYLHQASLRGVGCDCLGLLRGVWRDLYGSEPERPAPYTPDWAEACGEERLIEAAGRHLIAIGISEAKAGDVLLFRWRRDLPAKHVGILSAADCIIHAHDGAVVAEVPLRSWRRRIACAFRFPERVD